MYVKNSHSSFGLPPEPDFSSSAVALQTTDVMEQPTARTSMAHHFASQKVKPNIPQKKTHVDEMYRLKKQLDEAIKARDEAIQVKDMMADDLLSAQEEVMGKDDELKKAFEELSVWREKADTLSKQTKWHESTVASTGEVQTKREVELHQQIHQLTMALAERDATLSRQAISTVESPNALHPSIQEAQQRFNHELKQMEDNFRSQLSEEQRLRQLSEAELHRTKSQHETQLRSTQDLATAQIEAEKQRVQAMQLALNEQTNRMEIDSSSQEHHDQVIAKYEAEIRDQRQRCNQFRRTSERLTTQVKHTVDEKRDLERSDQEMRQLVEDMKAKIAGMKVQLRDYRMPGSFSDGQTYQFS